MAVKAVQLLTSWSTSVMEMVCRFLTCYSNVICRIRVPDYNVCPKWCEIAHLKSTLRSTPPVCMYICRCVLYICTCTVYVSLYVRMYICTYMYSVFSFMYIRIYVRRHMYSMYVCVLLLLYQDHLLYRVVLVEITPSNKSL